MPKSELLEKEKRIIEPPKYSDEEKDYLAGLKERLQSAKEQRDTQHDEFDGMDYLTHYESCERLANTFIQPKKNREDTNFQSGTARQKLFALLAALSNLNLRGDISAYDRDALKIQSIGDAMEDIIARTDELDNDEEKKLLRFYELLKHGTVFVEEIWQEQERKVKNLKGKYNGSARSVTWEEKIEMAFARPTRNIIPGTNVYLGDITKYDTSDQPFIFTVETKPYDEAKAIFGSWERWDNVPCELTQVDPSEKTTSFDPDWRLLEAKNQQVEIIRYQDKWGNEFAVLLNGVLMTPVGLPLPYGLDDYTLTQQNLEPIHAKFAYGKSLISRIKNKVAILDEFMRLGILKTQKSFMPPYLNLSGRVLTTRVFMPGKISHGIPKDSLVPLSDKESQGVTNSELAMISEIQNSIDSETTSPVFSGQEAKGPATATEIVELQRQAKMMLGLTIFAASSLEWKLTWKRLRNVLSNWFQEEETVKNGKAERRYQSLGSDRLIDGEGHGRRIVVPTHNIPTAEVILRAEEALAMEQGMPVRLIFINPDELNLMKLHWQVTVTPKEKKSSEVEKLLFRAEMADAQMFGPMLNMDYLAERFASTWNENPQKMFKKQAEITPPTVPGAEAGAGAMTADKMLPTAENALSSKVKTMMGTGTRV